MAILADKQEAEKRYDICKKCDHFRKLTKTCDICNCLMFAKTKLENSNCPIGKWGNSTWG